MKRIKWQVGSLAVWLTFLFNIERLDFQGGTTVNLASFVYGLAGVTTVLFLIVPLRRKHLYPAITALLALYLIVKVLLPTPLFAGADKFLTVTEVLVLIISAGLSWRVARTLHDFQETVEAISLPEGRTQLLPYRKALKRLQDELGRSRRYQRPLSVTALEIDQTTFASLLHRTAREVQAAMIARYAMVRVGVFLTRRIRDSDLVAEYGEGGRFLLVTPETTADQSEALLDRLLREAQDEIGVSFRYSTADFPATALTSEELVRSATDLLAKNRGRPANGATQVPEVPATEVSVA